jgi:uncharacterized protein
MESHGRNSSLSGALVVGLCALIGLAVAGFFIGRGTERLRSAVRTVTVKGLVEKDVKSDRAIWTLNLRRASADLKDAQVRIAADRDAALAFLKKQGFEDSEIERTPIRTIDKLAREYGQPQGHDPMRYILATSLVVSTPKVDLVRSSLGSADALLQSGVVLDGGE